MYVLSSVTNASKMMVVLPEEKQGPMTIDWSKQMKQTFLIASALSNIVLLYN